MTFIIRILLPGETNKRSHLAYGRWFTKDRPVPCRLLADVEAIRMQGNDVNIFVAESDFLASSFFRFNRSHFSSNLSQNFVMDKEHKSARHLFEQ
jgi:hypothetical protein